MTRRGRVEWGELREMMVRIHQRYPASDMLLTTEKLFCDNRSVIS